MNEIKHDNFLRVALKRKDKITDMISSFANLSNKSFYEFNDKEIDLIFDEITNEIEKQRNYLKNNKNVKYEL